MNSDHVPKNVTQRGWWRARERIDLSRPFRAFQMAEPWDVQEKDNRRTAFENPGHSFRHVDFAPQKAAYLDGHRVAHLSQWNQWRRGCQCFDVIGEWRLTSLIGFLFSTSKF